MTKPVSMQVGWHRLQAAGRNSLKAVDQAAWLKVDDSMWEPTWWTVDQNIRATVQWAGWGEIE